MAKVNFNLSNKENSEGEKVILLSYRYGKGDRLYFSTGEVIREKQWNEVTQQAKKSFSGYSEINGYLDSLSEQVKKIERLAKSKGIPLTNDVFKNELKAFLFETFNKGKQSQRKSHSVLSALKEYIKIHTSKHEPNTIKKFNTLHVHLTHFKEKEKESLEFETVNFAFYQKFENYLFSLGLVNDSTGKYISALKAFLKWAIDCDYCKPIDLSKFKVKRNALSPVALTKEELNSIYEYDFSFSEKLERVRDLFCFSAYTGMRFEDVMNFKKEHITNDEINYTAKKTKESLTVPLNKISNKILQKYNFELPTISNQKVNVYIKEVCRIVGLKRMIIQVKFYGNVRKEIKKPLHEYVRFHSAKKTFITLYLLAGGNRELLKDMVGNTYQTMEVYIASDKEKNKKEMHKLFGKPTLMKAV